MKNRGGKDQPGRDGSKKLRQLRCFSRSSLLTIAYITIIYERAMGRGEGWVEVPFIPPGWECA